MLETLKKQLGFCYRQVVADSGYESLGNYRFLEQNNQEAFIKPNNYESSRTRKFKAQIGRAENMAYYAQEDARKVGYWQRSARQQSTTKTGRQGKLHDTGVRIAASVRTEQPAAKPGIRTNRKSLLSVGNLLSFGKHL